MVTDEFVTAVTLTFKGGVLGATTKTIKLIKQFERHAACNFTVFSCCAENLITGLTD